MNFLRNFVIKAVYKILWRKISLIVFQLHVKYSKNKNEKLSREMKRSCKHIKIRNFGRKMNGGKRRKKYRNSDQIKDVLKVKFSLTI